MFKPKKTPPTWRQRQSRAKSPEPFRRNTVVISRRQRELAARQQSVTQRQIDKKRALERRGKRFRFSVAILAFVAVCAVWWLSAAAVHVKTADSTTLTGEKQQFYDRSLYQILLKLVPLGQTWLLDNTAYSQAVVKEHPEIVEVRLERSLNSRTPKVITTFRRPVFIWTDASRSRQYVDDKGVLFSNTVLDEASLSKLLVIEDQTPVPAESGSTVVGSKLVATAGQLPEKLRPLYNNAEIESVILPPAPRQIHIKLKGVPYYIKFSSERTLDAQIGELGTLLNFLKGQGITPAEYIDIRIADKAFYK